MCMGGSRTAPETCLSQHCGKEQNGVVKSRPRAEAERDESYSPNPCTDFFFFTLPFIYFFLNPVSLPEASNLLFNIGLYD